MIRVTAHPKDRTFLLLKVPQDLNAAMGTFGPAQLAVDLRGYVMPRDKLDALVAWARYQGVQMLNEAREAGEQTHPLECGNTLPNGDKCCAPYRAAHIPRFCADCGQPAKPVMFETDEPLVGSKCPGCHRVLAGGPRYCPHCGATMPERHLRAAAIGRVKGEPKPLAAAITEVQGHLRDTGQEPT